MAGEVIYRQWELLQELQFSRFGQTYEDLAQTLGTSKRNIQRDISTLQTAGFDIIAETFEHGRKRWKLVTNPQLSAKLNLSMTEMLSLFLSKQLLLPLAGTPVGLAFDSILDKIREVVPRTALEFFESLDQKYFIKNVASFDYSAQKETLEIINSAMREKTAVKVCYHARSSKQKIDSKFHPYGIITVQHALYCVGFLQAREGIRHLKISRIKSAAKTTDRFELPADFDLTSISQNSFGIITGGAPQTIEVRFTGWAGTYVSEASWHGCKKIKPLEGENVQATFELSNTTEFKRWVLGFGRYAKVLSPACFAEEIREEAAAMLE